MPLVLLLPVWYYKLLCVHTSVCGPIIHSRREIIFTCISLSISISYVQYNMVPFCFHSVSMYLYIGILEDKDTDMRMHKLNNIHNELHFYFLLFLFVYARPLTEGLSEFVSSMQISCIISIFTQQCWELHSSIDDFRYH